MALSRARLIRAVWAVRFCTTEMRNCGLSSFSQRVHMAVHGTSVTEATDNSERTDYGQAGG